jgi:hypothetical protein
MMIDDLPGALPGDVRAHTYVDDIAVTCHNTQEAEAVEASLIRYFAEHPAGPFKLRIQCVHAEAGFEHLGYDILLMNGTADVSLKDSKLPKLFARIGDELVRYGRSLAQANIEAVASRCCSPWPAITQLTRDAVREEVRLAANCPGELYSF